MFWTVADIAQHQLHSSLSATTMSITTAPTTSPSSFFRRRSTAVVDQLDRPPPSDVDFLVDLRVHLEQTGSLTGDDGFQDDYEEQNSTADVSALLDSFAAVFNRLAPQSVFAATTSTVVPDGTQPPHDGDGAEQPQLPPLFPASMDDVWTPEVVFRVSTICVVMVLTLVGNVALIAVITSQAALRRKRVSVFLLNLAVGDLMVCFVTMSTEILFVAFGQWVLGAVACKLIVYAQIVTLASTTFLLTAMSIDRYQVLVQPLRSFSGTRHIWRKMLPSWLLALIFAAPQLFIFVQVEEEVVQWSPDGGAFAVRRIVQCKSAGYSAEWQRKAYFTFLTGYILVVPTAIMTYCYAGIIRVVWLRTGGGGEAAQARCERCGGTDGRCSVRSSLDRPRIHFISSRKAPATTANIQQQQHPGQQNTSLPLLYGCAARANNRGGGGGCAALPALSSSATPARHHASVSSKRNVVKMTMSVIVGFVVCWTPYFVVSLIRIYTNYRVKFVVALSVSEIMALGHSALNPLLYMLFSRRAVKTSCWQLRRRTAAVLTKGGGVCCVGAGDLGRRAAKRARDPAPGAETPPRLSAVNRRAMAGSGGQDAPAANPGGSAGSGGGHQQQQRNSSGSGGSCDAKRRRRTLLVDASQRSPPPAELRRNRGRHFVASGTCCSAPCYGCASSSSHHAVTATACTDGHCSCHGGGGGGGFRQNACGGGASRGGGAAAGSRAAAAAGGATCSTALAPTYHSATATCAAWSDRTETFLGHRRE